MRQTRGNSIKSIFKTEPKTFIWIAGIKVLLSSGYSIDGQASEIIKRGCDGFIQKPFDLKKFSKKIREILDE